MVIYTFGSVACDDTIITYGSYEPFFPKFCCLYYMNSH